MEKEFAPYELAAKLKSLGFDEPCFGYYSKDVLSIEIIKSGKIFTNEDSIYFDKDSSCLAPTFSQAFRWFREKYKLHTEIRSYTAKYFTIIIQECKDIVKYIEYGGIDLKFKTHEEAELACLEKLIEIVKNK